jgi:flagellin-like hook-associated protein FlgL
MMAANTARVLGNTYDSLAKSTQRLSSGLRINSAADDAAGLAIRELMRSDIATMRQGIRNAADGISLLQTAEGAMAVIDEKLTRRKELAEQAATGTYTTVQREIINSEYQAMADEIDRIAASTEFNGVKLLDGSISSIHQGKGIKIHFGTGNNEAEDYYFINIGDIRATSQSGLRIGGDAKNDIWGTVGTHGGPNTNGCCGGGIPSLNEPAGWHSGEVFAYGYNWDWKEDDDTDLKNGRYIAGAYQVGSGASLQDLLDMVNKGTQARVRIDFAKGTDLSALLVRDLNVDEINALKAAQTPPLYDAGDEYSSANVTMTAPILNHLNAAGYDTTGMRVGSAYTITDVKLTADLMTDFDLEPNTIFRVGQPASARVDDAGAHRICIGNEIYYIGSATLGVSSYSHSKTAAATSLSAAGVTMDTLAIHALASAINANPNSEFWARVEDSGYRKGYDSLYVFFKEGGEKKNVYACDEQLGDIRPSTSQYGKVMWYNDEEEISTSAGTYFGNGGQNWGTLKGMPTGYGTWGVRLDGRDVGDQRDLWILNVGSGAAFDIRTDRAHGFTGAGFGRNGGLEGDDYAVNNMLGLDRYSFVEIQNAADGDWAGAHIRSQSHAQEALDAIQGAIERKDKIRAQLGSYQNRLENTITNLEIQAENLQQSESRISDMDMATEMTTFVKNQVLTQAAISMLSQANSLPQMALSLLNG